MKIGINLTGVSFDDGSIYRYRNYRDALSGFMDNVVEPLKNDGHEISFYLYTYHSEKEQEIISAYQPLAKVKFVENKIIHIEPGKITLPPNIIIMAATYIRSLENILNEDLDLVISTRYDINFFKNPFKEYEYDFTKCNFLWREPEFMHIPIVNDTFIVFPYKMTQNLINAILEMETNPPHGVRVAMHNIYVTMINQVGKDNVKWVCDEFKTAAQNNLYKLTRIAK